MQKMAMSYVLILARSSVVSACLETRETRISTKGVEYVSTEAELIEDGLVKISAYVKNVESDHFSAKFAAFGAALHVRLRGLGFASGITDSARRIDDIRIATSIYSINARLPAEVRKLDTEVDAVNCAENGIPLV